MTVSNMRFTSTGSSPDEELVVAKSIANSHQSTAESMANRLGTDGHGASHAPDSNGPEGIHVPNPTRQDSKSCSLKNGLEGLDCVINYMILTSRSLMLFFRW